MVGLSQHDSRSIASFATSFGVHVALIVLLSLLFFDFGRHQQITLDASSADDSGQLVTLESPIFEVPDAAEVLKTEPRELAPSLPNLQLEDSLEFPSGLEPFALGPSLFAPEENSFVLPRRVSSGFFGITPSGERIVYIIDMSVSMRYRGYHARRYDRAVAEVMSSINQLAGDQQFYVYLFCFQTVEMNIGQARGEFCAPTRSNIDKLERWLRSVELGSGTDPREAIVAALAQQPSCVFLLSDGEFNGVRYRNGRFADTVSAVQLANEHNSTACPIHTIGLEDQANQRDLALIAEQSGGVYRFIAAQPK